MPNDICDFKLLVNTATITAIDCPDDCSSTDTATADIMVCCSGCTYTIGYWKTHAGFTGNNPDNITPLLGTEGIWLGTAGAGKSVKVTCSSEAVSFLNFMGHPIPSKGRGKTSNGINKLYAQLLAARLNIANEADPQTISTILIEADEELKLHNSADWDNLNKEQKNNINKLSTVLDNYNNGLIGPPHCFESSSPQELTMTMAENIEKNTEENEENIGINKGCYKVNITINNSSNFKIIFNGKL